MHTSQKQSKTVVAKLVSTLLAAAGLCLLAPMTAQAGNVGWAVSVGGGHGAGYGGRYSGGWRPAAYGSGWGGYYGPSYGYPYAAGYYSPPVVYAAPPVITYARPPQPMVMASQPQPAVWYYCEESGQYFPYVQSCASGWQTQPAMPPSSNAKLIR